MPEFLFGAVIVLMILGFALVGFVNFVTWITGPNDQVAKPTDSRPKLSEDVLAARRLIDYLRSENKIGEKAYLQLRGFLDKKFPEQFKAPSLERTPHRESEQAAPAQAAARPFVEPSRPNEPSRPTTPAQPAKPARPGVPREVSRPITQPSQPYLIADTANCEAVHPVTAQTVQHHDERVESNEMVAATVVKPAPWDLPDPPPPEPRRSFGELMSGFMQEKNMRWGELASGILIVLSAVGLVMSLHEQLNAIPYFSPLMFMLITAAIIGAGIYTLKKWKLRNTSRGTLVIGLLLIPLNFVAACVLSPPSELNDPWLWVAISIGVVGFSAMTWWSSKYLLRRGNLPMTLAIMGCGIGSLILNRTVESASSSFHYLLFALPVAVSFLVGTCTFDTRQWVRTRWTDRASNRLFLFLGVSVFATVAALSLVVVRADSKLVGMVAISPIISMVCIIGSWLGSIVCRGSLNCDSAVQRLISDDEKTQAIRLSSLALKVLGLILLGMSLLASAINPAVFVVNALVSTIGLMAMFIHQKDEHLVPIAWGVFAWATLIAVNLVLGTFGFDTRISLEEMRVALINGKSALCLLLIGLAVGGGNTALKNWIPNLSDPHKFFLRGWITGGGIFLVGCVVALIASLVNRENVFDVMVASGLLILAAMGLLAVCAIADRKRIAKAEDLPHYASALLLAALAHTMLWNPTVAAWIDAMTGVPYVAWVTLFAIHALMMCGMGRFLDREKDDPSLGTASQMLINYGSGSATILAIGALFLIQYQSGWATLFELIASVCWFLVGKVWSREGAEQKSFSSAPFVFVTAMLVSVGIAELVSRTAWCPSVEVPLHWLIQLVGLSVWSVVWTCMSKMLGQLKRWSWLDYGSANIDQYVLFALVFAVGGLVLEWLAVGTAEELAKSSELVSQFGLGDASGWVIAAMVSVGTAMLISLVATPTPYKAAAMIGVWFLGWAYGAEPFGESRSVASALRWLLPVGGLVGAVLLANRGPLVPTWAAMRSAMGLSGKSYWSKSSTQRLINFALTLVAGVVLLISTVTVAQVLLNGADSLGGPAAGSWFKRIPAEISYGLPIAMMVATFLLYAISEKRAWLATVGSAVFQYVVVLAVVLLFLSPHPQLASSWFINILKAVSLGMTVYGFVWYWMRDRIEGQGTHAAVLDAESQADKSRGWPSQIEVHTLLNGLLITSLAVLAMGRYFLVPDQPGAWISSVGSPMGVLAWAAFGVLAFCIWRDNMNKRYSPGTWVWLCGWMGLILVGLSSAVVDRVFSQPENFIAWLPFRVVMIGAVLVGLIQTGLIGWLDPTRKNADANADSGYADPVAGSRAHQSLSLPVMLTGSIALTFAVRGAWLNPASFWLYIGVIILTSIVATMIGWVLRKGSLSFVSAATALLGATVVWWQDPHGWFNNDQPDWFNLVAILLSLLALSWTTYYMIKRKTESLPNSFVLLPNLVLVTVTIWIFVAAMFQCGTDSLAGGSASSLANPLGLGAIIAVVGLAISSLWNDHAKFRVFSCYLLSLSLAITLASVLAPNVGWRIVGVMLGVGLIVAGWGVVWLNRAKLFRMAETMGALKLDTLERAMRYQLPIYSLIFGGLVLTAALGGIFQFELRPHRYIAAVIPFALAVGLGTLSNQLSRRWLQVLTLLLVTLGVLFLAWADLTPAQMCELPMIRLLVRSLIVLSGAMFVYGGLVTRWVRPGDTWLKSLREMAVVTCGLAVMCLVLVVASEASAFVENVGCGLMLGESITVAILVSGMIAGLVIIALRPKNDPFALSLQGRMGYVYAAEFVCLALIAHLYFSIPWLFQLGIKEYWPYLMMALCFGGVGVAHVLEQRKLTVLGQPLFNTAAVLPLIVAFAIFGIDSEANRELVMLTVGLAYLMISFTHKSLLSGAAAVVFGNLALWMFFQRSEFLFLDHPQLWLIPPAISTLIASQLSAKALSANQLSAVRYVSVAVIYVSSTIEVFISGIGENLWPPVILAMLSVAGIMSGIMFRVKSFLYFGSLFLLMAMITMVAHAHRRLDHVWPWWAFGIGLGIAILVMFGLFEKRKNEMKAVANQLKDWEA